jgi:N6-L-threonylcarbamoyladenine synthase
LLGEKFIAFHLSGGTTEALLVTPDSERIIKCEKIAGSSDLKAGQAVDRVGVMLGLPFPAGKYLEELALSSTAKFKIKPTMKGAECCLSGIENKCRKMLDSGESREDIALFCLKSIEAALCGMTDALISEYGKLPLIYAGGVMSNKIIRKTIEEKYNGIFALPEFSSDNAAGIAVLTSLAANK